MNDDLKVIIITDDDLKKYLNILFKLGMYNNRIAIRYVDAFDGFVNVLVSGLKQSFGWLREEEIRRFEDYSKKCDFNKGGKCENKESGYIHCNFRIRDTCKNYAQTEKVKYLVNEIIITKHGAIRGL